MTDKNITAKIIGNGPQYILFQVLRCNVDIEQSCGIITI